MKKIAILCTTDDERATDTVTEVLEENGYSLTYFNRKTDVRDITTGEFELLIMYGTGSWWVPEVTPLVKDLPKMLYIYTGHPPDLECATMRGAVRRDELLRMVRSLIE